MLGLREIPWKWLYSREDGDLVEKVLLPALSCCVAYDRTSGYFNATTLLIAADGIEALVGNDGTMRLVVGCLTSPEESDAIERGEVAAAVLAEQKLRGALDIPDAVTRDALELLGWLVAQNRLQVRVALPRRGPDGLVDLNHIFHQKTAIFTDRNGDSLGFIGSANETPAGWRYNWESMTVCKSWDQTRPSLAELRENFDALWEGRMKTAYVIDIPTAAREDLLRYNPPDDALPKRLVHPPKPVPTVSPKTRNWREIRAFLSDTPALRDAVAVGPATCAVEPWPHQWQAFRRMYEPWHSGGVPPRLLIADEVGLGKTIEVALLLRQAVMAGLARRVLVMVPASLQRQWQRELREKAALDWPIYDGHDFMAPAARQGSPDCVRRVRGHWTAEPFVIASSHLLRRRARQAEVLAAEPWDLIVVDEAHHARREAAGTPNEGGPNRLLELLGHLRDQGRLRGLVLLTATPLQTALVEVFDLLALLQLPESWNDRNRFEAFFTRLRSEHLTNEALAAMAREADRVVHEFPSGEAMFAQALDTAGARNVARQKIKRLLRSGSPLDAVPLSAEQRECFRNVVRRVTPVAALVSRFTRPLLRQYGIAIARREPSDVFVELSNEEADIHETVERFLREEFNRASQIADGRKRSAIGFVLATYGKRLGSSLAALQRTLERHLARIEQRFSGNQPDINVAEDVDEDGALPGLYTPPDDADQARKLEAQGLAELELTRIREIAQAIRTFHARSDDGKLQTLQRALAELSSAGYDQAIVFTQYADTLDWLRDRLPGFEILCYSGRGGEYRTADGAWHRLTRDDTKRRFADKAAQLLICTDAAAEGLNLQTCGALVNYDLPWNPMRVEQRIGRIDRIGQPREVIRVVNLYYEGTIESQVYRRLQQRIDLFGDVVGKLQPILAGVTTFIERSVLQGSDAGGILADLDREVERLERDAFDLDSAVLEDLRNAADVPAPPYDLDQLSLLLDRPELLPANYHVEPLGARQWSVATEPGGAPIRVTSDRAVYADNTEDCELWTPGSAVFPALDPPRTDIRDDEYPATLGEVLQ